MTLSMRNLLSPHETDGILHEAYPVLNKIFESAFESLNDFREFETNQKIRPLKPRTLSEMMNRYIEHHSYILLDNHKLITPTNRGGRFWLTINGDLVISLKKLNGSLQPSNIKTRQSKSITHQNNIPIFPDGTCYLTLGYKFNSTQTGFEGIYFVCNDSSGKKIWHYDISHNVVLSPTIPYIHDEEEELSEQLQNLLSIKKLPLQKTNDAS